MSMFNAEQRDYMQSLDKMKPSQLCYCGWFVLGDCPHCDNKLTAADKIKLMCPECRNSPPCGKTEMTHILGCSFSSKVTHDN